MPAFILAACEREIRRGDNTKAVAQFEARVAATLTNLAKQVQGLHTLAQAQVALTDVALKYIIACVVESPQKMRSQQRAFAPGCAMTSWSAQRRKRSRTKTETLSGRW
jgi:hypothetical protein